MTIKLTRLPLETQRKSSDCIDHSKVVQQTTPPCHGCHSHYEVLNMFKTVAQSPRDGLLTITGQSNMAGRKCTHHHGHRMDAQRLANSLVSQCFSPSSEQPKQCILAYMFQQLTVSCIAIFHKCCCYTKHGGIVKNWLYKSIGIILLICQNTIFQVYEASIKIYHVLCSKTYSTPRSLL